MYMKKKRESKIKPMPHTYRVSIERTCTHRKRSPEPYGDWEESWTNHFSSIHPGPDDYKAVHSSIEAKPGEVVFVVWWEHSSGDSFGRAERDHVEAMGVFKTRKPAEELAAAIKTFNPDSDTGDWKDKYKFVCTTSDGQHFELGFAPWSGYFERLERVHVQIAEMGNHEVSNDL